MNIQIIGTKKCKETQKAERFFRERRIQFHLKDLNEKGLSIGELKNISRKIKLDQLMDTESKRYKERGLNFMVFNIEEELLNDSLLIKTPIVRNGSLSTVGYKPEIWLEWMK
jgi:arsenate reductase-like glutaredoxin family protein